MDTEFDLESQKSKDKELTRFFLNKFNVSDFSTRFFSRLATRLPLHTLQLCITHALFIREDESGMTIS